MGEYISIIIFLGIMIISLLVFSAWLASAWEKLDCENIILKSKLFYANNTIANLKAHIADLEENNE